YRIWSPCHTWTFLLAAETFYLLLRSEWANRAGKNRWVQKLSRYSFAVYIIHPVFLNALYKGLHFFPDRFPPVAGECLFWASVSGLAIVSSALLLRIPVFRKYL
ncbi:MAG: acyltransferase family protein, partial [Oscillibacter sp.]|nr:acyltransferase family protein [Oscillibacter sp.]